MEVAGSPPGNCQLKLRAFAEDVLVYWANKGPQPLLLLTLKLAVGGVTIVTVWVAVTGPQAPVAVKVTV